MDTPVMISKATFRWFIGLMIPLIGVLLTGAAMALNVKYTVDELKEKSKIYDANSQMIIHMEDHMKYLEDGIDEIRGHRGKHHVDE